MLIQNNKLVITRSLGDGIGPLIVTEASRLLEAALAQTSGKLTGIVWQDYPGGFAGFEEFENPLPEPLIASWNLTKVFFKGPWYTPLDGKSPFGDELASSYKSGTVAARKLKELEIILRPVSGTSILRQGTEGFYTAAEFFLSDKNRNALALASAEADEDLQEAIRTVLSKYRNGERVAASIATISKSCSETLARRAFSLAQAKATATGTPVTVWLVTKRNIFPFSHQLMADVFAEVGAEEFPGVRLENILIDAGLAQMIRHPEDFEVIATENLFGDIISDGYPELYPGTNMNELPSANIGSEFAMFEPTHGIGGNFSQWHQLLTKRVANPNGSINAGILMLEHFGLPQTVEAANKVRQALTDARSQGLGTPDVSTSSSMTTDEYVTWLIGRL